MMSSRIIDVLAPYEDEVLVSWIVRMLRMYKGIKLDKYTDEVMKDLFGPTHTQKPGLYLQKGLQYFCDNCGISNSCVFGSEEMMYEKLSVLPFYFFFSTEEQKNTIKKEISNLSYYSFIESKLGIRSGHNYIEDQAYYKFCPECMKLQKDFYLKREHQIQGNVVCWEHRCALQKLPYSLNWKDIDFPTNLYNSRNITSYELSELDYTKAICIAEMVHHIFINGFQDNVYVLKEKIAYRLKELKIVSAYGKFYNFEVFIEELDIGCFYEKNLLKKDIISAVFIAPRIPNPIIYLFLIQYLFGSLEEYYAYEYKTGSTVSVNGSKIYGEAVEERNYELSFYMSNLHEWLKNEYVILGETKDSIIIKHLKCGTCFKRSKKVRKLRKCIMCKENKLPIDDYRVSEYCSNANTYYVSTAEYGQLHGKKEKQIRNFCNENRIPGAIRVGKDILVPFDAPYPVDIRYRRNRK